MKLLTFLATVALATASAAAGPPRTDRYGDPLPEGAVARLGTIRFRQVAHPVAFSPDGKLIATSTRLPSKDVILWERATGKEVRRMRIDPSQWVFHLAFSPDGTRLACFTAAGWQSKDNRGCVFEVASGRRLFPIRGTHGAFTSDGKVLVSADCRQDAAQICLADAFTGKVRNRWPLDKGTQEATISADGQTVAVRYGGVRVRDAFTGKLLRTIRPQDRFGLSTFSLAPDGKAVAIGGVQGGVELWDVATGKLLQCWKQRIDCAAVFSPDGKALAWAGEDDGRGKVWLVKRGQARPRAVGSPSWSWDKPCFAPDGKTLAVLYWDNTLILRDIATGKDVLPFDAHLTGVDHLSLSADGRFLVSGSGYNAFAWEWRTGRLVRRHSWDGMSGEKALAVMAGGRVLLADRKHGTVRVCDGVTGKEVVRLAGKQKTDWVVVSADGSRAATVEEDGRLEFYDLATGKARGRFDAGTPLGYLNFSPDGRYLMGAGMKRDSSDLVLLDAHTSRPRKLEGLDGSTRLGTFQGCRGCFSPDGHSLILPGAGRTLRRWDLRTGKELLTLRGAMAFTTGIFHSPGEQLVGAWGNGEEKDGFRLYFRVWEAATGRVLFHLTPASLTWRGPLFFPDGRTLVTTNGDGIQMWEVATGKERARFQGHLNNHVESLALSADGRVLFSGGGDSQILAWDLAGRRAVLTPAQLRQHWQELASIDGRAGYRALWALALDPERALPFLKERLRPVARPDPARVARLLAELDDRRFATRRRAAEQLEKIGEPVTGAVRQALARAKSLDSRRHFEQLLERLDRIDRPVPAGASLQALRTVEALEHIGGDGARKLLAELAAGAPDARLTREAKVSLQRLRVRPRD
jgi:WD40 repeat protein